MSQTLEQMNENLLACAKTFVWHQIFAPSDQKSMDFYTGALDFTTTEMPMGEMGTYKMLVRDGHPVAGVVGTENCGVVVTTPHWSVSIAVDDVDARVEKCVALGAKVLQPAFDIPTVGRMALIEDPQGAPFWLFRPC
jgi:predicted enzyme related to lactoylglutathione lyase